MGSAWRKCKRVLTATSRQRELDRLWIRASQYCPTMIKEGTVCSCDEEEEETANSSPCSSEHDELGVCEHHRSGILRPAKEVWLKNKKSMLRLQSVVNSKTTLVII